MESERAGRGDVKEERGARSGSGSVMEVTLVRVIAGEVNNRRSGISALWPINIETFFTYKCSFFVR